MNISFFEIEEWEKQVFQKALPSHTLTFYENPVSEEVLPSIKACDILSTFIYSDLSEKILSHLPNLKLITTRSTGFDHIDLGYCQKHTLTVCNVPTYGVNTIAEHTFSLILALSRKLILSVDRTRQGEFHLDGLRGFELSGKTLGVIGFGHIGKKVASLAKCFGMNVLVSTRHPQETTASHFVELPYLLKTSDIVSLHIPLTKDTKHLINKENIGQMKKGSILINTARGGVIETEAIVWALEQGILSGAGLDVLEEECVLKEERELLTKEFLQTCDLKTQLLNHVLLKKDNVIITPHNAFNSTEALEEIVSTTISNIQAFLNKHPINTIPTNTP